MKFVNEPGNNNLPLEKINKPLYDIFKEYLKKAQTTKKYSLENLFLHHSTSIFQECEKLSKLPKISRWKTWLNQIVKEEDLDVNHVEIL
jgi:hypothetical protein